MATSQQNTMPPSASAFVCSIRHCVGLLQVPPPSDTDQVLTASCLVTSSQPTAPDAATTTINVHDDGCSPLPVANDLSSSESDQRDDSSSCDPPDAPTFGVFQLKAGFVRLHQLVTALVVQVSAVASDVVSLKDRITAVEGTQAQSPALAHALDTEALTRRINELCERVASQEQELAQQRAETELYKKTMQELTTRSEMKKIDKKIRESLKSLQHSIECQAARVTAIKADAALKIALLQSELVSVQMELAMVKTVAEPANAQPFCQSAKDARRTRILASVAQQMEEAETAETVIEDSFSPPPVVERSSACAQDQPVALPSSSGQSITFSEHTHTRETTVDSLTIPKEFSLAVANTKFVQPDANIPSIPVIIPAIPTIPKPIPPTSVNGDDKENELIRNSTMLMSSGKTQKTPTTIPKKIQRQAASPSKASVLPKHRRSMLPGPASRKLLLPGLAKQAAAADDGPSSEAKAAGHKTRGPETPDQLKTSEIATTLRSPLESTLLALDENEALAVLPSSSSLAALDVALQALQPDEDSDVLTLMQVPDHSDVDLSFSSVIPHPIIGAKSHCEHESLSLDVPPKERTVAIKPSRRL